MSERLQGMVKFFEAARGFGFLWANDTAIPDVFVHISRVRDGNVLQQGDRVEFSLGPGRKPGTEQAIDVVRLE